MARKSFIESSTVANWILLNARIKELQNDTNFEDEKRRLLERCRKIKPSYELLEEIRIGKRKGNAFYTSQFALIEVMTVIREEYLSKRMSDEGIPLRYWTRYRDEIDLPEDKAGKVIDEILDLIGTFSGKKGKIKLRIITPPEYDPVDVTYIVTKYKCYAQDAILLATARKQKANYFVTDDRRLREISREKILSMKLISSQEMLSLLRRH